jgi:hypothetical protein
MSEGIKKKLEPTVNSIYTEITTNFPNKNIEQMPNDLEKHEQIVSTTKTEDTK